LQLSRRDANTTPSQGLKRLHSKAADENADDLANRGKIICGAGRRDPHGGAVRNRAGCELGIDASTNVATGPTAVNVSPSAQMALTMGGYGVTFLKRVR
jgi:hypothetical protein